VTRVTHFIDRSSRIQRRSERISQAPYNAPVQRRLFKILSVLSLLLFLGTLVLWVRSHWVQDWIVRGADEAIGTQVHSGLGRILCFHYDDRSRRTEPWAWSMGWAPVTSQTHQVLDTSDAPHWWNRLGFAVLRGGPGTSLAPSVVFFVLIPHWSLAVLFAVLPALYLRAAIRSRRRLRIGLCPVCGATPGRCPECGAAVDPVYVKTLHADEAPTSSA
jgi:hypothetical protein